MSKDLEEIEQKALNFLTHVSNPLVRIDVLHEHVTRDDAVDSISVSELQDFLGQHEQFRLLDSVFGNPDSETKSDVPLPEGTFVILMSRVPSEKEIAAMMLGQLDSLHDALTTAQAQATSQGDVARIKQFSDALQRVQSLKNELTGLGGAS